MTRKQRITIGTIVIIVALMFTLIAHSNKIPQQENNKPETIWGLVDKMDSLRSLKEECVNNLNIVDSAKFLKGYTWYCDSWDAEIIELRDQISLMSKKDYEGLN
jgi:hypothetical protein